MRTFGTSVVHDALKMAEQTTLSHKVMEIVTAGIFTIKIRSLDTTARMPCVAGR
jgi:hypothetical protein